MNLSLFGERLSELIAENNLSVKDVVSGSNVSKTAIYSYLKGIKMPTLYNLIKLADFFKCSTDYIVGIEDQSYTQIFNPTTKFSTSFEKALTRLKISRYKLEKLTGISESTLYYWAKGITSPSVENLITVSEALDCSLDFLIGRVDLP